MNGKEHRLICTHCAMKNKWHWPYGIPDEGSTSGGCPVCGRYGKLTLTAQWIKPHARRAEATESGVVVHGNNGDTEEIVFPATNELAR
jgi:hypothetical protein